MSSLPAPPPLRLANDLITACTTHFSNFSQLRGKRKNSNHRKPLCHEFGRFRLWAHGFKGVMPECDYLLDEVLQEAIYLKEPTIMLLASFAGCLLADCLSKVGNDNTRGQLELSLSHVNREYPNLEVPLSREWNTQVAAIGEFRKCVDDLFDMLPTLDNVLETIQERGRHRVKAVEGDQTPPQTTPTTEGAVDVPCVPGVGYRYQSLGSVYALPTGMSSTALPLTAGERQDMGDSLSEEMEDPLDKAAREEISAHPKLVEGVHHDIYQRYIKDRFPQAIEELDIESFAKGNVECYERLIKCVEEEASLARNPKPPPSSGVPQTIGDSGVGSSLPRTMLPPPPPTALLAPPGSISSSSQSTICSTSSEPRNRRLVPRIPEHSQFSTGFKCAFCGGAQRPTRTSHAWRKHVFSDLAPYMCIRSHCAGKGTFYSSKMTWVAHDMACIGNLPEAARATATVKCVFCVKEFNGDTGRFYSHVAHHMEDIRLFALPPTFREYEVGEYLNSSNRSSEMDGRESLYVGRIGAYLAEEQVTDFSATRDGAIQEGDAETNMEVHEKADQAPQIETTPQTPLTADHSCEFCQKTFPRLCDLTKHRKTHDRPFKCDDVNCKYHTEGFPTNKEKERHQNDIHALNRKEWKCQFAPCTYKSMRESNCKQHMEKAHQYVYKRMKRNPRRRDQRLPVTQRRKNTSIGNESLSSTPGMPNENLEIPQVSQPSDLPLFLDNYLDPSQLPGNDYPRGPPMSIYDQGPLSIVPNDLEGSRGGSGTNPMTTGDWILFDDAGNSVPQYRGISELQHNLHSTMDTGENESAWNLDSEIVD